MATYQADRQRIPQQVDPSSQHIIEADASTPRILIHQAGVPPFSVSNSRVAANTQVVHAGQWQEDSKSGPRLPSYVFAAAPSQPSPQIGSNAIHDTSHNDGKVTGQSLPSDEKHSRHDSIIKSSALIGLHRNNTASSPSSSASDTSAGAQDDFRQGRELKVRRSATFFCRNEDAVVQSPIEDSARGGAQPPDESTDDALNSAVPVTARLYNSLFKTESPNTLDWKTGGWADDLNPNSEIIHGKAVVERGIQDLIKQNSLNPSGSSDALVRFQALRTAYFCVDV
jgi:hypothetical protein